MAWGLRHLPVFGVFGSGTYRVQPIHVADLADLAVAQGGDRAARVIDAIGPETFTYRELAHEIAQASGVWRPIISVPPRLAISPRACLAQRSVTSCSPGMRSRA
jgi:NADH dehydrogenase